MILQRGPGHKRKVAGANMLLYGNRLCLEKSETHLWEKRELGRLKSVQTQAPGHTKPCMQSLGRLVLS